MMFCEIIRFVQYSFFPENKKLILADAVADPIKTHVDGFRPFLFDAVVGNAGSGAVVGLDRSGRLRMAKFFEGDPQWACFFAIVEEGGEFSFSGTGENFAHDLAKDVDGAVGGWLW
jgi:hypothetical protein